MKIGIITTINHNIGDDFVREGIKYLLKQYFKDTTIEFSYIHKHAPVTVRYGFENIRKYRLSKMLDNFIPKNFTKDRIFDADIIVQSGAPVYWCHPEVHCFDNEWYKPLIKQRFQKKSKKQLFLNIAAGSCQTYNSEGSEFCKECNLYIKDFYDLSDVTTLRDHLAKKIFNNLNIDAPVIPCSSIFAIDELSLQSEGEEYVVFNYMKGGAHYTFGQNIDFVKWEREFKKFYFEIKEKEKVIISCHNQKEVDEALELDPNANIFYKKNDYKAYMKFYSKAKFGFMNRVHGAFLMASYGKPSMIIGNDSRARMATEIGLESFFVNDVDYEILSKQYEYLKNGANDFKSRFQQIKSNAYNDYMTAFSKITI